MLVIILLLFWNSYLLTCGSDGDVRIYKDFDDSDPESVRVGDNVTVLAVKVSIAVFDTNFPANLPSGKLCL